MENYLHDRNYLALYLNSICVQFASALMLSFVGASLILQGMPLYLVFLYFGLEFLARALFSPLGSVLTRRWGLKSAILIANLILIAYFFVLSTYSSSPVLGFSSLLLYALSRGIYHPTKHFLEATFIRNSTRGRFLTMEIVLNSVCAALAVGFATYSVTVWHTFFPVAILAAVFLLAASFIILSMLDNLPKVATGGYRHVFRHFLSAGFRRDRQAFAGFAQPMAFNNVVVALLVYFVVDSLKIFGIVMVSVFLVQMVFTLVYGRFTDENRIKSNKLASGLAIASQVSFWLAVTPLLVAVIKSVYDAIWNIFDSSFTARFHQKIKLHGLVFGCAKEMSIGFAGATYCLALSASAYFWHSSIVFSIAIILACIGIVEAWKKFTD